MKRKRSIDDSGRFAGRSYFVAAKSRGMAYSVDAGDKLVWERAGVCFCGGVALLVL